MNFIVIWLLVGLFSGIIALIHDYFMYGYRVTGSDLRLVGLSIMLGPIAFLSLSVIFYKSYKDKKW